MFPLGPHPPPPKKKKKLLFVFVAKSKLSFLNPTVIDGNFTVLKRSLLTRLNDLYPYPCAPRQVEVRHPYFKAISKSLLASASNWEVEISRKFTAGGRRLGQHSVSED